MSPSEITIVSYIVPVYIYHAVQNIAHILNASIIFPILEVTIGFNRAAYSVSEDAGNVSAIVSVLSGTLARDVSVRVFTSDATAVSEGGCVL